MKQIDKKILYVIVLLALISSLLSVLILGFVYEGRLENYKLIQEKKQKQEKEFLTQKLEAKCKKSMQLYIEREMELFEEQEKVELSLKVNKAYKMIEILQKYMKNRSLKKEIVGLFKESEIFISDYNGNAILLGKQQLGDSSLVEYVDKDARSIVLEEIQKVQRHGEGFLTTTNSVSGQKEIIFVKNVKVLDWFIGAVVNIEEKKAQKMQEYKVLLQGI